MQLTILFLCVTINMLSRNHMGVTIVAMTSNRHENMTNLNATIDIQVTKRNDDITLSNMSIKMHTEDVEKAILMNMTENGHSVIYNWPKSIQEIVLNSFIFGYVIMMFPMGMVCQRFGSKLPLQISLSVNGIASILTPWLTTWGNWKAVCFCRILQGLSQAGTYPSIQAMLAKWTAESERATLGCMVYTGITIGTVIGYQLAGFLGASNWGWPSIFYAIGLISLGCFILLTVLGTATPLDHKYISEEEKEFIIAKSNSGNKTLKIPWRAIITSKPLWAIFATNIGSFVTFVFLLNQVPSYMHHILGVNLKHNGLLSSLPHLASFFSSLSCGWISDYFTNRKIVSVKNARRIFNSISQCGVAFSLMVTSFTNNITLAVATLVVATAAHMMIHTGWMINAIDLAPNFSGTVMGISFTFTNICVLCTPVIVSHVVTDMTNVIQWRIMFFIVASISLVTNAVFVVFMSTDIQPWNYAPHSDRRREAQEKEEE